MSVSCRTDINNIDITSCNYFFPIRLRQDPDGDDYNRNRAMAAVGSGGLLGKGYQNASVSSVESNHVPESETDFIFCPFAEEWGFVGSLTLVLLYLFVILRVIIIAERQKAAFNRIYAYAVAMILFYHFGIMQRIISVIAKAMKVIATAQCE